MARLLLLFTFKVPSEKRVGSLKVLSRLYVSFPLACPQLKLGGLR